MFLQHNNNNIMGIALNAEKESSKILSAEALPKHFVSLITRNDSIVIPPIDHNIIIYYTPTAHFQN